MKKILLLSVVVLLFGCATKPPICNLTPDGKCAEIPTVHSKTYGYPLHAFEGAPIRNQENVQQIWIGPYEDEDGNYHEPSYVYTVVKKGSWFGEPVEAVKNQ